jgi:hemolysin D
VKADIVTLIDRVFAEVMSSRGCTAGDAAAAVSVEALALLRDRYPSTYAEVVTDLFSRDPYCRPARNVEIERVGGYVSAEALQALVRDLKVEAARRSDRTKTIEAFLADNLRKLADARRTADEKDEARAKAAAQLEHMRLTAPVDGEVQALSVTNPGQVVTSGQEVMRIVPSGGAVQIEAYVTNDDVGFVAPGQRAVIKVDAFPFTRYGTVDAEVVSVAHDAVPADAANQALDVATRRGDQESRALTPEAKPMTDLVFLAKLRPVLGEEGLAGGLKLLPGMTVTAEVKTGSRRVLDYVLSPVGEALSQAARER